MAETVAIVIEGSAEIDVPWKPGMTIQAGLEAAYNQIQNAKVFSFACQYFGTYQGTPFGPLGYMVIMANGVYDLPDQGQYWALLVNGAYASKGIDLITLAVGDKVQFVNEPYLAAKHADTAVEQRHLLHRAV